MKKSKKERKKQFVKRLKDNVKEAEETVVVEEKQEHNDNNTDSKLQEEPSKIIERDLIRRMHGKIGKKDLDDDMER